jgi:NTE family protein
MSTFLTNLLGAVCIEDAQVPLAIVATDIETYQKVVLKKGLVSEAVRASTCIPGLFAPVEVEGKLLVDGGLSENVPLSPLRAMGADIVIGVNLTAYQKAMRPRNFFHIINNTYTTLSQHRDRTLHEDADILIEPDLTEFDPMRFERAEDMFAVGYHAMCDALPKLEEKITSYKKENGGVWRTVWHTLTRPLF